MSHTLIHRKHSLCLPFHRLSPLDGDMLIGGMLTSSVSPKRNCRASGESP